MSKLAIAGVVGALALGAVAMELVIGSKPAQCACSSGHDCEALLPVGHMPMRLEWREAPKGHTHQPDQWRGAGCVAKECTDPLMPEACQ